MEATLDISVVVPLYNEEESLPELMAWIHRVMQAEGLNYEVIMVDDGYGGGDDGYAVAVAADEDFFLK